MASSRGCAPAGASSLWLHAASRRRPSLRQAPGAVADQPRPRGHPALLPSAPHARARGLKLRFSRGRAPAMRPRRTCPAGQTACRSGVRRSAPWPGEHPSPRVLQPVCGVRVCVPVGPGVSRAALQSSASVTSPGRAGCRGRWSLPLSREGAPGASSGLSLWSEGPAPAAPPRKPMPFLEPLGPPVFPWGPLVSAHPPWHSGGYRPRPPDPCRRPASQPPPPQPSTGSLRTHAQVWAREGVEGGRREAGPGSRRPVASLVMPSAGAGQGARLPLPSRACQGWE